jgi:hypothetical protein
MGDMPAPDAKAVPIATYGNDSALRVRQFDAGCQGQRPSVHPVEAVRFEEGRKAARASDAGGHHDLFRREFEVGKGPHQGIEHRVVSASGTPDGFGRTLVALRL